MQNDQDCPNQVVCDEDLCQDTLCQRFLTAECRPDNCNGNCLVKFFYKGREVTDKCGVETCDEKECPERRTCIEEVYPPSCPDDDRHCRQYIRSRCELPPPPRPPSDCSLILCPDKMPVCVVEETRLGPRARCRPPPAPTSCDQVKCDEGMECHHRDRDTEGKPPVIRCVPKSFSKIPTDCSAVLCPVGTVCMLFGQPDKPQARCVRPPRVTCEDLDCESSFMICHESSSGPRCENPQKCTN